MAYAFVHRPDDMAGRPPRRWRSAHICRRPPSESGIALYGSAFLPVLSGRGEVVSIDPAGRSGSSQSLRSCLRGVVFALLRPAQFDLVHVELSGRALAELWIAAVLLGRTRRPIVTVTCHDLPSIVGASGMFSLLDRPGLRRVGQWLSDSVGQRVERHVLEHADVVCVLTRAGGDYVRANLGREPVVLGLVLADVPALPKESTVFMPGPLDEPEAAAAIARAIAAAGQHSGGWKLAVGMCSDAVRARVSQAWGDAPGLQFTGRLSHRDLLNQFAVSLVVVRPFAPGAHNRLAASGPLSWSTGAGCIALTNDDRAGARELQETGRVLVVDDVAAATARLLAQPRPTLDAMAQRTKVAAVSADATDRVADRFWSAVEPLTRRSAQDRRFYQR